MENSEKSKVAAGLFGILLGGLGIHKFYMGKVGIGLIYILFCWTGIPAIIGAGGRNTLFNRIRREVCITSTIVSH